ncbi:MAG: right-handed parallel beta-helix repeat-containing protein, partial [Desulfatitalea sp.]
MTNRPIRPNPTGRHPRPGASLILLVCALLTIIPWTHLAADTTVSANITTDTTWTLASSPYIVTGYITVQGATTAGATLTIEPGVQVRFNSGRYLNIGGTSGNPGALIAQGTAANPIVFTSNQATPTAGYWSQIKFDDTANDATTILEHCTIQYAGSGGQGSVYLQQASPTIRNTTIANSSSHGIYISNGTPTIDGCQFSANGNYDLYYTGTVGGSVSGSTIR